MCLVRMSTMCTDFPMIKLSPSYPCPHQGPPGDRGLLATVLSPGAVGGSAGDSQLLLCRVLRSSSLARSPGLGLVIVRDAIEKFGTQSFLFLDPWALGIGSLVERRGWPLLLLGSRTLL